MDDQKALSAVSRSLRRSFVAKIQVVTVTNEKDLALVNQSWPLLSMVILHTEVDRYFASLHSARSLARVGISAKVTVPVLTPDMSQSSLLPIMPDIYEKFFLLKPLHTSASLALASSAAKQLAHHLLGMWPKLRSFKLTNVELPAVGVAIIAQLAKGDCSSLYQLTLSHCGFGTEGCLLLSQANWPALRMLDLTNNRINAEGTALLAKANCPKLMSFQLSHNPILSAEAMAHLSAAKWPLKGLILSNTTVSAALPAELAQLHLSNLTSVTLTTIGHTAAAICELARADWPVLTTLDLAHNALDASAMKHLCRMHMPALTTLGLNNASITGEGAYWLAQGSWPRLKIMYLAHNQLDAHAARHIVSGLWPNLHSLSLEENPFGDEGLQELTKGDWPLLDCLAVSLNMLNRNDTVSLLGLDPGQVQQLKSNLDCTAFQDNSVSRADERLWPNLKEVKVVCVSSLQAVLNAK